MSPLLHWWVRGKEVIARISSSRAVSENLRVLAPERVMKSQVETVRRLAASLAPAGVPMKLYLLPQSNTPLFDLTCCFAPSRCETVSFHSALLARGDRRRELAERIDELFHRCLAQASE